MNLTDCLEKGYLVPEPRDEELIRKELQESNHDLTRAQKLFVEKDYK